MFDINVKEEIVTKVVSLTMSEDVAVAFKHILGSIPLNTHIKNGISKETALELESIYFRLNEGGIK